MIKRPLPILLLFFIGGIVLGYSTEIPRPWILGSLAAGLILSLLFFVARRHAAAFCLIGSCFFALGTLGISMTLHDDPAPDHIAHWAEKGKIVLDGIVSENPRVSEDRTSLVLEASRVSGEGFSRGVSGKILLSVGENTRLFKVGDLIRTETRLKHPRSFGNPGAFDYERYLRLQGIRVRG
ncbi:MAG TPA: ComEC/Rec2 family competence protein, partial [Syntrophales bacterium]